MRGVIGYGSLLNPDEVDRMFGCAVEELVPVCVDGYRRSFAQKSLVREGGDGERAILRVDPSSDDWFNAVVIPLEGIEYENYLGREAGYTVESVDPEKITTYQDGVLNVDRDFKSELYDSFVTAVGDRPLENPDPIPTYLTVCVEGALYWGDRFLRDFFVTTYIS